MQTHPVEKHQTNLRHRQHPLAGPRRRILRRAHLGDDPLALACRPLSYVFIGSILAAIAIPLLWIALSGELAAMQAGAIDLAVMYAGMFVYVATLAR